MTVIEKLAALRALMKKEGLSAYIVPGTDPHASEYMAARWTETTWLSGFTGEAGTVVVTMDRALLWTDSRYYLQADIQLRDTTIELMRESDIDCPPIVDWLSDQMVKRGSDPSVRLAEDSTGGLTPSVAWVVGVNPEMWSVDAYAEMAAVLPLKSIDLIRPLWTDNRPAIPQTPCYVYDEQYAGESVASKLARMREKIAAAKADSMVISALDEIVWLLNIRGYDVEFNPVVISYVVLEQDKCTLFICPEKVDSQVAAYLAENHIDTRDYEDVFGYIRSLTGTVMYDGAKVNEALYEAITCDKKNVKSPILIDKAHKNAIEIAGERKAMVQDSIALTRFFQWLETNYEGKTEWELMEKLHEFRMMGEHFVEESFGTIAGYMGNGAIVHYAATADNCATIGHEGVLLLDSGGQYLDGTTDITRTVWLGDPTHIPAQAKRDYTYVLKGHLALGMARWPRGTRGNQLDALAKQFMWEAGITFGHGTGHGMGHFLGCHEGPQNVRTDMNPTVLEAGHVCSDEPGIYRTGKWGIRIENIVTCVPAPRTEATTTDDEWLTWEHLTLCYYDRNLMDMSLLTEREIAWIDAYHQRVYDLTAPHLDKQGQEWLRVKCAPLLPS